MRHAARIRHAVIGALAFAGVVLAADAEPGDGPGWTAVTNPKDVIAARGELMEELRRMASWLEVDRIEVTGRGDLAPTLQAY